jgi:hypothetical protein
MENAREKKYKNTTCSPINPTPWYMVTLSDNGNTGIAQLLFFLLRDKHIPTDEIRPVLSRSSDAMIILSVTAVPIFHRLNIYTAYEFLEQRFDLKNRLLGSILF